MPGDRSGRGERAYVTVHIIHDPRPLSDGIPRIRWTTVAGFFDLGELSPDGVLHPLVTSLECERTQEMGQSGRRGIT